MFVETRFKRPKYIFKKKAEVKNLMCQPKVEIYYLKMSSQILD